VLNQIFILQYKLLLYNNIIMSNVNQILRLSIFNSAFEANKFLLILKAFHIDLNLGVLYDPKINKYYLHQKKIHKKKKIFITI